MWGWAPRVTVRAPPIPVARRRPEQGDPRQGDNMTTIDTPRLDEAALEQFVHQAVGDLAAAISGLMVHLGDRLGLYRAMAGSGPMTPTDLAERTGTHERYVREWLSNQAAGGYVTYDADDGTFELGAEHALVLAHESPVFLAGAFETIASVLRRPRRVRPRVHDGRGHRLGRPRRAAAHRGAAAVPVRLRGEPGAVLAPGPRRGGGQAAGGGPGGRRRLWLRGLHGHHGHRRSSGRPSSGSTATHRPSRGPGSPRPRRASPDAPGSRWTPPRTCPAPATTW